MKHTRGVRTRLRRRRRADRPRDRPREERHVPHGRRRRPRHDGARRQDDVRHAAGRSLARAVRHAARAGGAGRARRARRQDQGRILPQGGQGHPGARSRRAATTGCWPARSAPEVAELLKMRAPAEKFAKLRASAHPQAQFLWAIFRDLFHYSAYHLAAIADNARDVDLAIRWGFGWQMGPFETWQAAGWNDVAGWLAEDIAAGKTLCQRAAACVGDRRQGERGGRRAHAAGRVFGRAATSSSRDPTLPVYRRQLFPDPVLGERADCGHDDLRDRCGAHVAPGRRRRHRVVQEQGATRSAGRSSTASIAPSTKPSALARAS